jgi:ATP-dependent RNA helicase RhlB
MNNPIEIENQPEEITVNNITQELYHISSEEKFPLLLKLLAKEDPKNCLIFTNTKAKAVEISKRLGVNGFTVRYLMGDLPQNKRLGVINRMKSGELRFLVATDVAARGLQIDDLALVINYDIPEDFENYVHRIGRTARAGKSGKSITLACEEFVYGLEPIEAYIQMKIPVIWPQEDDLPTIEDKSKGMRFRDLVDQSEYASKYVKKGVTPYTHGKKKASNTTTAHKKTHGQRGPETATPRKNSSTSKRTEYKKNPAIPPRGGKSYQDIQKMDLNERMEYYKKKFSSEEMGASNSTPQKRNESTKKPGPKKPTTQKNAPRKEPHKKSDSTKKVGPAKNGPKKERIEPKPQPSTVRKEESKKKSGGFLSRLFGRKK